MSPESNLPSSVPDSSVEGWGDLTYHRMVAEWSKKLDQLLTMIPLVGFTCGKARLHIAVDAAVLERGREIIARFRARELRHPSMTEFDERLRTYLFGNVDFRSTDCSEPTEEVLRRVKKCLEAYR